MDVFELAVVISAVDRVTATAQRVQGSLGRVAKAAEAMDGFGQRMAVQGALMKGGGDKITGALEAIATPAMGVQDALAKVATVITPMSGTTADALERVKAAGNAWASEHKANAAEFIDTTYAMISAGLNERASIEATRVAMQVATATFGENTAAASLIATIYNNMGDKTADVTTEMARLGDVVTKTQQAFQFADLNQLSEGLKYATPIAMQFRMSIEETSTVIGALNSAGIVGSQAGTSFAATMRQMSTASKALKFEIARTADGGVDFIGTLANLESKFGSLESLTPQMQQKFQDAFGSEGWAGLSLMVGKSADLRVQLDQAAASAGAAAAATAIIEGTDSAKLQILNNNLDAAKASLGEHFTPILAEITPLILSATAALGGFAKEHPELVRTAIKVAAVAAALLTIGGSSMLALGSLSMFGGHALQGAAMVGRFGVALGVGAVKALAFAAALLMNPITWIVLAIAGAAFLIYTYWDPIKAFFVGLWNSVSAAFDQGFVQGVTRVLQLFNPLYWIVSAWDAVSQWLFGVSLADAGANILKTLTQGIMSMATAPVDAVRGVVAKVRNLLPFSPAKDGPLRDLHRIRLVETIADSVRPDTLVDRMRVTARAVAAVPLVAGSMLVPMPQVGGGAPGGASASGAPMVQVTFNIEGNADAGTVEKLEEWARANASLLFDLADREAKRRKRLEFDDT